MRDSKGIAGKYFNPDFGGTKKGLPKKLLWWHFQQVLLLVVRIRF